MRNIFLPSCDLSQATLTIDGPDGHHLATVLRVRVGEVITVLDDRGFGAEARVEAVGKRSVEVRLCGPAAVAPEPPIRITVAQALGKGDRFEQVVQHGTEAGASEFVPLLTERTVAKLDGPAIEAKVARWRLIAKGAAEQSGRSRIPVIGRLITVQTVAVNVSQSGRIFVLDPNGKPIQEVLRIPPASPIGGLRPPELLLVVGPEGGFSPKELSLLSEAGALLTSLGDYVLRTETAALIAVAQILFAHRAGVLSEGTV